ncbi:RNA 2',3'-cyclic phosphodiesterase [Escherichia coli]|nr:RNA 2',3'-cyclic phosphodiesterase [Escherichia coli]
MSEPQRLFFAIDLPAEIREQIIHWRATHFPPEAGRPVAADNLHLTLAFLGEVSAEKEKALSLLAGRIRQPGFTLTLDDAGQWLRSRVVWLGMRQPPRGLIQLANMLRSQAARSGCFQSNRPFHPHITLLRDASEAVTIPPPGFNWSYAVTIPPPGFNWSYAVTEFTLYASSFARGRTRYTPLKRWALTQ